MDNVSTADEWFAAHDVWPEEVAVLRQIVRAAGLVETLKWRQPAYTLDGKNVALVSYLKTGAVVSFFKGPLIDDPKGLLVSPGKNSRHTKFMAFTSVAAIEAKRADLEGFLQGAIAVERSGQKVAPLPDTIEYVAELVAYLAEHPELAQAFERLTPGRRRAYNLHFGGAKRAATRVSRIEKAAARIRMGKGLQDCICGHSQRMPRCDGSHKKHR